MPGEPIPPPDNLRPVDPNALGVPKAPPEEITPVTPNISGPDKPGQSTPEEKQSLIQPEQKERMTDTEWQTLVGLGGKSALDLMAVPEDLALFQRLTEKGKKILGTDFDQELARRNAEAKQQKKDRIDAAFSDITEKFKKDAQALLESTQGKQQDKETLKWTQQKQQYAKT